MNKERIKQIIDLIEGIPLYEWEQLKIIIDREFKSQANKTQFKKRDTFVKDVIQELIQ